MTWFSSIHVYTCTNGPCAHASHDVKGSTCTRVYVNTVYTMVLFADAAVMASYLGHWDWPCTCPAAEFPNGYKLLMYMCDYWFGPSPNGLVLVSFP